MRFLGFKGDDEGDDRPRRTSAGETRTVRRIVNELESLDKEKARYLAAFAYILSRVAHADLDISTEETRKMEDLVTKFGHLPEDQAILVVQIAKSQNLLFGSTEDYLVTREFKDMATREQCVELLHALFAVSAADESISSKEEHQIRKIASELGFDHNEFVETRSEYGHLREVMKDLPGKG
jgi:uncharacterized tellurite resistance protein B-like protein